MVVPATVMRARSGAANERRRNTTSHRAPMTATPQRRQDACHEALSAVAGLLALSDATVPEVLDTAAAHLAGALRDSCLISLVEHPDDDGRPVLHLVAVADPDPDVAAVLEPLRGVRAAADRGFTRHVVETASSLRLPETAPEVVVIGRPELRAFAERFGIRSLILAPLRLRGRALGHVALLRHGEGAGYVADDERLAQAAADVLALAVAAAAAEPDGELPFEPTDPDGPAEQLTEREREVLGLLALGHTNREIAERLVLSVRTVEWHRARMQWKLGVSGRAALADIARSQGLVG